MRQLQLLRLLLVGGRLSCPSRFGEVLAIAMARRQQQLLCCVLLCGVAGSVSWFSIGFLMRHTSPDRLLATALRFILLTGTVKMHNSTIARHVVEVLVGASYVGILAPLVDFILWSAIAGHLLCLWLANSLYIAFSAGRSVMCVMGAVASICSNCYHDLNGDCYS